MTKILNITPLDLREYGRPPEPSIQFPFAQVDWIFSKRMDRVPSNSGKANYRAALKYYKEFLIRSRGSSPYFLHEEWNEFALLKLKQFLDSLQPEDPAKLKSYSLVGHFSAVRQAMKEAVSYKLVGCSEILNVVYDCARRETDAHESYSDEELSSIFAAISIEMRFTHKIIAGYEFQNTSKGRDPRIDHRKGAKEGYGWQVEENVRWYFEHEMKAKAIPSMGTNKQLHKQFFHVATNTYGGLHNLYKKWGVSAFIDEYLVMPLAVNFLYLTGLNPSSLLKLRVDCLREEHPLTGMPYILFEKERSGGENELHLPLLDTREERSLKRKQSLQVRKAIADLIELTQPLRDQLPVGSALRDMLFIYQSSGQRTIGEIKAIREAQTSAWCKAIVQKHNLRTKEGTPLNFNLVRFRSTKLTEMALEGRDFFEIQQVARHKNINTTLSYVKKNKLDVSARKIVLDALERIHANRAIVQQSEITQQSNDHPIKLYRGLISNCKNVFDPPEQVKKSLNYTEGRPCTNFNLCLFCKNVVIMREHLPSLVGYRAQIVSSQSNNIQNLPHANLYDNTLEVLDNLLDPDQGEFSRDDIDWATEMAESLDFIVDPILYHGTQQ